MNSRTATKAAQIFLDNIYDNDSKGETDLRDLSKVIEQMFDWVNTNHCLMICDVLDHAELSRMNPESIVCLLRTTGIIREKLYMNAWWRYFERAKIEIKSRGIDDSVWDGLPKTSYGGIK